MWSHLIVFIVGVAAGCSIKDLLGKSSKTPPTRHPNPPVHHPQTQLPSNPSTNYGQAASFPTNNGFSLRSIQSTFDEYGIKLIDLNSFGVLLREIRKSCYKKMLKQFIDNATTPEKLVELLNNGLTPTFDITVSYSTSAPYISDQKLNSYLQQDNVPMNEFHSMKDKVTFLLSLYHSKGIDDFKKTLSVYLTDILEASEKGLDISEMYNKIMTIINNRYNMVS